jgi:hypothetical protein
VDRRLPKMHWGKLWGSNPKFKGNPTTLAISYWGADKEPDINQELVPIKSIRGRIIPCEVCKLKYKCAMYQSLTRNRMTKSVYTGGTGILHWCKIFKTDKIPGSVSKYNPNNSTHIG